MRTAGAVDDNGHCLDNFAEARRIRELKLKQPELFANLPTIKLEENSWASHKLTTRMAAQVLETVMGYPVERISRTGGNRNSYEMHASGDAHANLEIWPSNKMHLYERHVLTDSTVEDGGFVGYTGHNGWYIPTSTNLENFDMLPEYWRHLQTEDVSLRPTQLALPPPPPFVFSCCGMFSFV